MGKRATLCFDRSWRWDERRRKRLSVREKSSKGGGSASCRGASFAQSSRPCGQLGKRRTSLSLSRCHPPFRRRKPPRLRILGLFRCEEIEFLHGSATRQREQILAREGFQIEGRQMERSTTDHWRQRWRQRRRTRKKEESPFSPSLAHSSLFFSTRPLSINLPNFSIQSAQIQIAMNKRSACLALLALICCANGKEEKRKRDGDG